MPPGSSLALSAKRSSRAIAMHSGNPMPTKPPVAIVSPFDTRATAARALTTLPFSKVLRAASVSLVGRIDLSSIATPVGTVSVDPGEVIERNGHEYRSGLDASYREYVAVRGPVGQTCDREQRDHRSIVWQRVHATARHRRDPMEHFEGNIGCLGHLNKR